VDSQNSNDTLVTNDLNSDTITIGDSEYAYTIDTSLTGSYSSSISNYANVTINNGGTSGNGIIYNTGAGTGIWGNITTAVGTNTPSLHVTGNAEFEDDIKIKGVSIMKTLEEINRRLAILVPNPDKLEHFEALKKAYEHYKMLEALCQLPTKEED
jgi:hypothetical protein